MLTRRNKMEQNSQQGKNQEEISANQYSFLMEEYKTLREEIKATKDRIFKIAGLSAAGMPYSYVLAQDNDLKVLKILLPLLVLGVALLYISENISLMRCGRYIKNCIEPIVINGDISNKWKGWEYTLAEEDLSNFMTNPQRAAERIAALFFYIFFTIYYIASVIFSVKTVHGEYGLFCSFIMAAAWFVVGLSFAYYLKLIIKKSISTSV